MPWLDELPASYLLVGQVAQTLSKNDQRWGILNLLRRLLVAEWETPEQVRDSRATQWGTVPSKGHFSTESWKAALPLIRDRRG
jgi:hypothetical protein